MPLIGLAVPSLPLIARDKLAHLFDLDAVAPYLVYAIIPARRPALRVSSDMIHRILAGRRFKLVAVDRLEGVPLVFESD